MTQTFTTIVLLLTNLTHEP